MALLICSECGGKVSSLAASCPHCGAPVPQSATQASPTAAASVASGASVSPSGRPVPNPAPTAPKQPMPLNVPLRTYRGQSRAVSIPLLLGIFFLPFIFVWFLLQKGYSTVVRVAGFAWLIVVLFMMIGMWRLASDLFWSAPTPALSANGAVTTTQDPSQIPVTQQPLRPLTLPAPQVQNNPVPAQQPANSQQLQAAPDPIQFNQSPPPVSIDNAANSAANPTPSSSDNNVNPFNDTRPIHPADSGSGQ